MNRSLSSRLAALYALLLGITVVLVIVASSAALLSQLHRFEFDIVVAKHEEARELADEYAREGQSLAQAAPTIANVLSGIGLRVAVFDEKGRFLGGDKNLHSHLLDRIVAGRVVLKPPLDSNGGPLPDLPPGALRVPRRTVGAIIYHTAEGNATFHRVFIREGFAAGRGPGPPHAEPWSITSVRGGYVVFAPGAWLIFFNLLPYWRLVLAIAIVAIALSWWIGRGVARQALAPLGEVTSSLQALAEGDYTQRRFVTARGDEIATLTGAYNDAAAGVASAMEQRKRVEERMRQFVADAGHELRTPLTVIAGYIDVLRRGALEEPKVARAILGTMVLEKEHMRGLIDRLMRLARLDSEAPPVTERIDLGRLLASQCESARRLDETVKIDYRVDGTVEIVADKAEVTEAIWNAIENALKYAPGAPIHLRAAREGSETVITVADEGPGMSESERLHAFERFFRGDARGEIPGTGLGLAIAKRAIDRAGGTAALQSAPGAGTTVAFRLPSARAA